MTQFAGILIVVALVFGGLLVSGSDAILAALPLELGLIGGAALGTLFIGNSPQVALSALGGFATAMRGPKWKSADYLSLFSTLHDLLSAARRRGLVAIEADIENPESSSLFARNPRLLKDTPARELICDTMKLLALDLGHAGRAEVSVSDNIDTIIGERHRSVSALHTVADALPALGIVAAVLGIIRTMTFIDQSPAVLGEMIAIALLGTFLGVFLAYAVVGPIANRYGQIIDEDARYLDIIRNILMAHAQGASPRAAIELARASLPARQRPSLDAIDEALTVTTLANTRAAA